MSFWGPLKKKPEKDRSHHKNRELPQNTEWSEWDWDDDQKQEYRSRRVDGKTVFFRFRFLFLNVMMEDFHVLMLIRPQVSGNIKFGFPPRTEMIIELVEVTHPNGLLAKFSVKAQIQLPMMAFREMPTKYPLHLPHQVAPLHISTLHRILPLSQV